MSDRSSPALKPSVISEIVANALCIGCGACVPACPDEALEMQWNRYGLCEPVLKVEHCSGCSSCLEVCPFSSGLLPDPHSPDENVLGASLFGSANVQHDPYFGYYEALYAGFASTYRSTSSSGGIGTWTLVELLESRTIDAAICVQATQADDDSFFEYALCRTADEIRMAAKTRYHPAPLDGAVNLILRNEGRYAIVGIPCSLKALRLLQRKHSLLQQRIVFMLGIMCGGLKSRNYTEFLAAHMGVRPDRILDPEYRMKSEQSTADDYAFSCTDLADNRQKSIKMSSLGDMWGTGMFKPSACDYCDDLSSELADMSIGDAWIDPYRRDGKGTSIVIVRSILAREIINRGIHRRDLALEPIEPDQVNDSQRGNISHRRIGLQYRLYWAKRANLAVPIKRVQPRKPRNPLLARIHRLRMQVRKSSHEAWLLQRTEAGTEIFDSAMEPLLQELQYWTRLNHRIRKLALILTQIGKKLGDRLTTKG